MTEAEVIDAALEMRFALRNALDRLPSNADREKATEEILRELSHDVPLLLEWRVASMQLRHFEKTGRWMTEVRE